MPNRSRASGVLVVCITCPTRKVGQAIGHALVEDRLAACVNIVPGLTSIYRWEGKLCKDAEVLLIIKTRRAKLRSLIERVKNLHPYSVPEIIALPVAAGSAPYLSWVQASTR